MNKPYKYEARKQLFFQDADPDHSVNLHHFFDYENSFKLSFYEYFWVKKRQYRSNCGNTVMKYGIISGLCFIYGIFRCFLFGVILPVRPYPAFRMRARGIRLYKLREGKGESF